MAATPSLALKFQQEFTGLEEKHEPGIVLHTCHPAGVAVTRKGFGDLCLGQHSVSLGVQEGGLASASVPGSPAEFFCWPSEELGSQGLFGVQLASLVQGSGAYPMMQGQNSQHPYEETEADRSALATGSQVAMVNLALCMMALRPDSA